MSPEDSSTANKNVRAAKHYLWQLLIPEAAFIRITLAYGLVISLLTLAVPIAVQTLINTVVNVASTTAVVTLALLLALTLGLSSLFAALRIEIMERYERHLYARLAAEISARTLMAEHKFFEGRKNTDLTNRYFDIDTFQKNVPPLLIDGFTLLLQMLVGFTLVSFYHPVFLMFSLLVVFSIIAIWTIWGKKAIATAVNLSHAKHANATWLDSLTVSHSFFKSDRHIEFARQQTEQATARYIDAHKKHFRQTFSQTIALFTVYVIASSALLGLGGTLVIQAELSIGQLVAAELILTAIFFGLSQSYSYLKLFYELCGSADEIGLFFGVPLEEIESGDHDFDDKSQLEFNDVVLLPNDTHTLNFSLEHASKVIVVTKDAAVQRKFILALKRSETPASGWIRIGDKDLRDYNIQQLRRAVTAVDRTPIVNCSIMQLLTMSSPDAKVADIEDTITLVGLKDKITKLKDGLETELSPLGTPLLPHEFLLLKLAAAILSNPKIIILTQYFDNLDKSEHLALQQALDPLPITILYFTNHPEDSVFQKRLDLDALIHSEEGVKP
jgi:ABC-type bacteriocin/lantibiotic exporter with double-glycine peptidase domain